MSSTSPVPSAAASQAIFSEAVTNQALMNVILDLRAQLTSLTHRQDELTELVTDLRRELQVRTESTVSAQSLQEPASIAPREAESVATSSASSPTQGVESAVEPRPSTPTRPIPASERRIRRQNTFYIERPASPPSTSFHPPVSRQRVSDSPGEGNHLPPPYSPPSLRLPPLRGFGSSSLPAPPLPQAQGGITLPPFSAIAALSTLPIQPAPTPRPRPLHRESAFYHVSWLGRAPYRAPGPGIFQPPPRPPAPAPTTSPAFLPFPKRKREDDVEDTIDGVEASDKKRARRPSTDDVD